MIYEMTSNENSSEFWKLKVSFPLLLIWVTISHISWLKTHHCQSDFFFKTWSHLSKQQQHQMGLGNSVNLIYCSLSSTRHKCHTGEESYVPDTCQGVKAAQNESPWTSMRASGWEPGNRQLWGQVWWSLERRPQLRLPRSQLLGL